jgi:hypothetical protein
MIHFIFTESNLNFFPYKYFCICSDSFSIPVKVRQLNICTSVNDAIEFQDTALTRIRILFIVFLAGRHYELIYILYVYTLHLMVFLLVWRIAVSVESQVGLSDQQNFLQFLFTLLLRV